MLLTLHRPASRPEAMICPCSRSRHRWLRNFCSLLCAIAGCCSLPSARAQSLDLEKPLLNIDEDISAFSFAPDGRIVYSVRRHFRTNTHELLRNATHPPENAPNRPP